MHIKLKLYITFLIHTIATVTIAQGLVHMQHYSTENGLSQNIIQDIIQDDDGFIWLATRNGLEQFDGYIFKNYKSYPTDVVKLASNRLVDLAKGGKHTIWCETFDNKIYLFNTQSKTFENVYSYHPEVKECNNIRQMIALENGVLWIVGTEGELWRINETQYKEQGGLIHYPPQSSAYHGNQIYDVALDPHGNEWILTNKGYFVYGKKALTDSLSYRYHATDGNDFYLMSNENGLAKYIPDKGLQKIAFSEQISSFQNLFPLRNHMLCITTTRGFVVYHTQTQQVETIMLAEKENNISPYVFHQAKDGSIWMLNGTENILHLDLEKKEMEFIAYQVSTKKRRNKSLIHEDEYGQIWILPTYGELACYNPKEKRFEPSYIYENGKKRAYDYSYYRSPIRKYLLDSRGNLWHYCEMGLNKISFLNDNYRYFSSSSNTEIRGLFIDSKQLVWVGNKNGMIEIYDNKMNYCGNLSSSGQLINDKEASFGANIYCLFEDDDHRIWMGSKNKGLYIASPQGNGYSIQHYLNNENNPHSISFNSIYSIHKDIHGRIWIGTFGGGIDLVTGTFPQLKFTSISGSNDSSTASQHYRYVRTIHCTSDGIIMAGTTDGLITFSSDFQSTSQIKFHYNHCEENRAESLANNDVLHILENGPGEIYVVTYSGGISFVKSADLLSDTISFTHFNRRNGLPSDIAYAIIKEDEDDLWINFETCICKFNAKSNTFETYDRYNLDPHLLITEVPPVISNSHLMYLGTSYGPLCINLKNLRKSTFAPTIAFTNVSVQKDGSASKSIAIANNTLELEKDERNVTISFAALDFTNIDNLQYAYRLKEVSDDWVYIGPNHSANFVNLPSGDCIFEVKSTNGDGVWTDNVTQLSMHISPTFWETGWAWAIYIVSTILLILVVSGILTYIFNLKRKVSFEQQLTNLKLRFFTDISHELRTPLTLITAPVEEVLEQEKLSGKGFQNLTTAKQNIDRMLRLVNQLLDFRKIQNNKMKLYIEQTDVIDLFRQTFNNFSNLAEQKSIRFQFISPYDCLLIFTDRDKLEKILFNLLSNAFKYTPNGKSITLSIKANDSSFAFKVKDEGIGFDMNKVDILFDRFETLGKRSSQNSSGIGMSLVNELVHLIHGTINVNSVPSHGSEFIVSIPNHYTAYNEDKNAELILNDGNNKDATLPVSPQKEVGDKECSILVVEDNQELRLFIVSILQESYQVYEAADGAEGFEKTKSALPDLIISDIMMPRIDGIELLDKIRNDHDVSHIPVILLSAKSTLEDRISGLEYGADDYITKPFSSGYLKARVASLLNQRRKLKDYFTGQLSTNGKADNGSTKDALKNILPTAPSITPYDETFIKQIVQSVEEQLMNQDFRIEDLADKMNLSRTVFYRKIKSILGVSPIDFVKDMRVKRAVQLLDTNEYSISEIAYMSGFSSPQYFSRVFKDVMKCTPSEYKTNTKK